MNRRGFLTGLVTSLVAAPAVVSAASLMPIRGIVVPVNPTIGHYAVSVLLRQEPGSMIQWSSPYREAFEAAAQRKLAELGGGAKIVKDLWDRQRRGDLTGAPWQLSRTITVESYGLGR